MTFYHGTASTFEKPILKFGLRPSGETWGGLGVRPFGPSAVWVTDSFENAVRYARLAARVLRAKKGDLVRGNTIQLRLVKGSPVCDPNAQPIVFAIEMDESEPVLVSPGEFRLQRTIPPEWLSLVRGSR